MGYLLAFVLGTIIGMVLTATVRVGQLDDSSEKTYLLFNIAMIIKEAEKNKTPSVIVVQKIKEAIQSANGNNF